MEYTPDSLRCRYPEFEDTTEFPDERIEMFIADAQDDIGIDETHWGGSVRYTRAIAALVGHMLVLGTKSEYGDTGPSQAISTKKAGSVSVSLMQGTTSPKSHYETRLASTTYGQDFLALRRRSFIGLVVIPE